MIPTVRYTLAFIVNVVFPMGAYRIALPHYGLLGALIASAIPLLVWMSIDLVRFGHFDALSALVLASIAMSLLVLVSGPTQWLRAARDPMVSGVIGVFFLLSLMLHRPLVFYLARSTMSRSQQGRELEFDASWRTRPALVKSIRLITIVWGLGLVGENMVRLWVTFSMGIEDTQRVSTCIRYATYGVLTLWTMLYRHLYIKRQR